MLARNAWTTLAVCLPLSAALACGPSRNREVTSIIIEAPADRVWAVVGNYGDLSWTGRISTTEATGGSVPEVARRRFTFASGAVFTDTLTAYDPAGRTLSFRTDDEDWRELPVEGYVSKLTVREENGKSIVEWRGAFSRGYLKNDPPPELSDDAAVAAVSAFQKASLFSLKQKMESGS